MNLRDLQYLVAVAEHRHFGKAAEAAFVSQPTLSTQIKKLEQELGVELIERNPRQILLTDAFGEASNSYQLSSDVEVEAIRLQGAEAARQEVVDVLFFPEGNATAAELVLRTPNTENRVTLQTDAVTGTAKIVKEDKGWSR